MLDPQQFVQRWSDSQLGERQAAQSHFIELCQLISHAPPSQYDQAGVEFCFEKPVSTVKGSKGFADVWYKDHFAWEYKGKHKDLDAAYDQLSAYRGGLDNPPLLVVCDFLEYRIYPQWPNMDGTPIVFHNDDLVDPLTLRYVRWLLEDPTAFLRMLRPDLAERNRITRNLAEKFAELAGLMRQNPDWQPMQIARFLTKIAFTLFVDDIRLLPIMGKGFRKTSVVESIIDAFVEDAGNDFPEMLQPLFEAMDGRTSRYIGQPVPYFNGGLFADSGPDTNDGVEVLDITQIIGAMDILRQVSEAEWQDVNPTIFGTLFEGALDDSKRAQLGAHYTDEPDIRLVVEPVLMQPLRQQWEAIQAEAAPLLQTYATATAAKPKEVARLKLVELHDRMMHLLENTRVLDPACGSGNFLYVSLLALKDLEAEVRRFFGRLGLPFRDVVTPRQLYGIEKDEFAAKLAHVVVWIGYL
ncbi:MAG: SAM-dependent methyltransferase, partial [Anaerolineae bacterium]|nr:SAM-dependent methyltransferase [Anaerolineae bacterium]